MFLSGDISFHFISNTEIISFVFFILQWLFFFKEYAWVP